MKEEFTKIEKFAWHSLKHENHKECINECKVQQALILLGKKYLMPIIRLLLLKNTLRFNEILDYLNGSPKTITARLRELEKYSIINRTQFNEIPPRVEYSLTNQGKELEDIFERLANWALDLTFFNKKNHE
jgi:DNA-binding HxlR family transcriptional regulator